MKSTWSIVTRDAVRLWRTKKVWAIVIGVMITPALYAWVNIAAFWDPYDNTENINVAVVNNDQGASSKLTGDLDVGSQIVDQLNENDQLGWKFMDAAAANDAVERGDVFATLTVPPSFSADFLSLFQGEYSQPTLQYRVNEKTSAIGPKITDQGATTIDNRISSTFKKQVSDAVATELRNSGGELSTSLNTAGDRTANSLTDTAESLGSAQDDVKRIQDRVNGTAPTIEATKDALESIDRTLGDAVRALGQVQSITDEIQRQSIAVSDSANTAYFQGSTSLTDAATSAANAVSAVTGSLESADSRIEGAISGASGLVEQGDQAITQLQQLLDNTAPNEATVPLTEALNDLRERNITNRQLVSDLGGVQDAAANTVGTVIAAADTLEQATIESTDASRELRTSVSETLPALNSAINQLSSSAGGFSNALESQQTLVRESIGLLDGTDRQLTAANDVLDSFIDDLSGIETGLRQAQSDVALLKATSGEGILNTVSTLDSDGVSQFFASPAEVESHAVFPVANYGSGMAALFTNLAMWVGSFMLVILFRTEVDTQGLKRASVAQAYVGRFLLLAIFSVGQALVVSIGNLFIGVQTVSPLIFMGTCLIIGLAYFSIVFGLVAAFGHIGRGIAVVLAFIQIPGASGLYPIEMVPDFFRDIFPFLPFTHGIGALRETIGGFYGNHYWMALGSLTGMAVVAFILGLMLRRGLSQVKMLVHAQLAEDNLVVHEKVELTESRFPLPDIIHALRDRDGFREEVDSRWKVLREHFPVLLRLTILTGVIGVIVLTAVARSFAEQKAIMFGLVCVWILMVTAFVSLLEYTRHSFARAQQLAEMPDEEIRRAVATPEPNDDVTESDSALASHVVRGSSQRADSNPDKDDGGGER